MTALLRLALVLTALPVLGGYLGGSHPIGDSLAVFRPQGAATLAVLAGFALWLGQRRGGIAALGVAAVAGLPVLWAYAVPGAAGSDLRLYQKNMLFRNDDLAGLLADIRTSAPDVLTLQEVSPPNRALLAALTDSLPHQLWCPADFETGPAIATRLPPMPGKTLCAEGLAAMQVQGPKGPFWLVSVHLSWPWPYPQDQHLQALLPVLQAMKGPVVMAGDFNMVRWSNAMTQLSRAVGSSFAGPVRGTYVGFAPWVVLPIDHVVAPSGGRVTLRPELGSDHRGLLAEIGF